MKTYPLLPDLDLARIAPMPTDQKRVELQKMRDGRPPYSLRPMRNRILDILNVEPGPLASLPRTPWATIERAIRKEGRSPLEIAANLQAAEGLYVYASDHNLVGRRHEFFPLAIGIAAKIAFWSPIVLEIDGRATVPYFDPRKAKKLTAIGRQFAFSVMHERIRAADPDFSEVELAIVQFENEKVGPRAVVPHFDDGLELFDFNTLDEMVRETYSIWHEILDEREADTRRRGAGAIGSLV